VDPLLLLALLVVAAAVVIGVGVTNRRRRDAALEPTRLGPTWTPNLDEEEEVEPEEDEAELARRVNAIAERTGVDTRSVEVVLAIWREYLAVLGLVRLPATHRYRLYDPYNPPVARRDADGQPTPDRERVARDVGNRTEVPERDAEAILEAEAQLSGTPSHPSEPSADQ
jgi:hypothetical protein